MLLKVYYTQIAVIRNTDKNINIFLIEYLVNDLGLYLPVTKRLVKESQEGCPIARALVKFIDDTAYKEGELAYGPGGCSIL